MILAPNHSSFMDHFLIGASIRRKVQFMAKSQLFKPPMQFIYTHGGVFPVRRGHRDEETFVTALKILADGGCVAMYCEGGRSRTGRSARSRVPGIGRLALESGATIVPVAIHGSSRVRNWRRLQFPKVTVQYGEPFRYERVEEPTRDQQQAVADEILDEIRSLYEGLDAVGRPPRSRGRAPSGGRGAPSGPPPRDGVVARPAGIMPPCAARSSWPSPSSRRPAAAHAAPVTLAKVGDFSSPVYVTAPLGDTSARLRGREGRHDPGLKARRGRPSSTSRARSTPAATSAACSRWPSRSTTPTSGLFYVYYTAQSPVGQVTIEEHRVDPANPDRADPSYARTLVTIPHDQQANHNGGQLQFGPDGLLYAGTGDGGSGGDPSGNAQTTAPAPPIAWSAASTTTTASASPALDPATGAASIFAYGLRNPWRFSFDRNTGDLVIGDVGQDRYEEVDFARGAGRRRRRQLRLEHVRGPAHAIPAAARPAARPAPSCPVIEYPHGPACSITGGYVVRDAALPELAGTYLYGDNCTGAISGATLPAGTTRTLGFNVANVSSFGEDGCGRVYAASLGGAVYRFASSGACAGPAPFVGRLPAGVVAAPPDHRAPAFTLLRAAARQHALRTGFVTIRVRCDEQCTVSASGRVLITRGAHAAAARGPAHAHREGDAGGRRAHDTAPEALQGHPPLDQAVAGPARAPGHGAHRRARGRSARATRARRDAARADRAVVAAQLPPRGMRPIS